MSETSPADSNSPEASGSGTALSPEGMSPYATGGGGVTFERKVAVQYLARLLIGDGAVELGEGRRILSVAFQQAPAHSVDDLVMTAARPDELQPSLVLALAVRRSPNLVQSDESTRRLIRQFVRALIVRAVGRAGTPIGACRLRATTTRQATSEPCLPRYEADGPVVASSNSS